MAKKSDVIEIIKVSAILFAITAVATAILAGVNSITAPKIEENERIAQQSAMKAVLPEAENFEMLDASLDETSTVVEIYDAGDAGVAVKVAPTGYGGKISMIVGIDNEFCVTGIEIISQSETAGLGAKCTSDDFKGQFAGKTENLVVVKNGAVGNQVDAISSATITSKAVTLGVNDAIVAAKALKGGK